MYKLNVHYIMELVELHHNIYTVTVLVSPIRHMSHTEMHSFGQKQDICGGLSYIDKITLFKSKLYKFELNNQYFDKIPT